VQRGHSRFLATAVALALLAGGAINARAQDGAMFGPPPRRTPIVVGLPVEEAGQTGEIALEPNVRVKGAAPAGLPPAQASLGAPAAPPDSTGRLRWPVPPADNTGRVRWPVAPAGPAGNGQILQTAGQAPLTRATPVNQPLPPPPDARTLPSPPAPDSRLPLPQPFAAPSQAAPPSGAPALGPPVEEVLPRAEPMFAQAVGADCLPDGDGHHHHHHKGTFYGLGGVEEGDGDPGIGHERVEFAPYFLDVSQPSSNMRFRFQSFYNEKNPDRVEYFWAQIGGRGPKLPEHSVDYQDAIASWEVATGKAFSITTDIPIQLVAPNINPTTAGMGDMTVTTKTVLLTGNEWQITQIFRTYIPTGAPNKGLGTGHVSLEPGFLFRYKWTPETYFNGELEYWFPLGGNPIIDGQVLTYGFGISHLMYESDTYAVVPTLEFKGWTVFNGGQTNFPTGVIQPVDTMGIFNVCPGVRFIYDTGGDLGLLEWGVSSAFAITTNRWYDASFLIECRFVF